MSSEVSLNDINNGLEAEEVSLSDFDEGTGGALAAGWYPAEIIEGYATRKGTQIVTADDASQKGDSRNLKLCFDLPAVERKLNQSFNYRPSDFTSERQAHIKELRKEFAGVRGAWPDKDAQRSSLALVKFARLEQAVGFPLKRNGHGGINPTIYVGQKVDIRLVIGDDGYNEVVSFAKFGEKTTPKARATRQ